MKVRGIVKAFFLTLSVYALGASGTLQAAPAASAYQAAGNQLYQTGDFAKAAQYYQAAVQLDPTLTASFVGLGNSQYRLGRSAEALAAYDRALALDPSNAQLSKFVTALKATATGVPSASPAAPSNSSPDPLQQANALFSQKQYAQAIPFFEQAAAKNPSDARAQYYWAYACAMTGDNRGAALHFYRYNALSPNPGVQAYAERLKISLPLDDQRWVDAQVSGATNALVKPKRRGTTFGLRLLPALVLPSQSDLKNYAKAVTAAATIAQTYDPTRGAEVDVPTGFLSVRFEPYLTLNDNLQLGAVLGFSPVGHLKTINRGTTSYDGAYTETIDIKFSSFDLGANGRYFFGLPDKKMRPFLGFGLLFASVSAKETYTYTAAYSNVNGTASGSGSSTAFGAELLAGFEYALGRSAHVGPVLGYRLLKASKVFGSSDGGNTAAPKLDLGGPVAGLVLSASF